MTDTRDEPAPALLSRREFLKKAGAGAAALGVAGATAPFSFAGPLRYKGRWLSGSLTALTWVHFVPSYDQWLDPWAKAWGEKNDVQVTIEHINNALLDTRAAAEVAAQSGHDLFFNLHPMAVYEDQVINHSSIIKEVEAKVGKYLPIAQQSTYNPRTKKYFAVSDSYVPDPVVWRHDLWNAVGESPATWDHVKAAAPKLKAMGHPIGIGQSQEIDSNMALIAFMMCFGSFIQNENNKPTLLTKNTIDAVKFMAEIARTGETNDIFSWNGNAAANNNYLYAGTASLIFNAISATRTPESGAAGGQYADDLWIWPIPAGPHGRIGLEHLMGCWSIWKFAKNRPAAERFLADLCIAGKDATIQSQLYNFPTFANAMPFKEIRKVAAADKHKPLGKYTILTTIAEKYTHNIGYPGTTNAAIDEIFQKYLIPQMFAQVSQGKLSAEDSVRHTNTAIKDIYAKWRKRNMLA
ncbi:MAG TPA: ABC transporter substrate-binding protein [Gaiellaceae bacterium]|nr:ABC transporter substrate-binding protein [Gaiellaceae bacterium]